MRRGNCLLALAILFVSVPLCRTQVLAPPEILDPAMRALQQRHLPELKAAAVEITSHQYPYKFYLSRTLDLTERQEQQTDQRSIRFANFQGRIVLQVTGNYFAAYSDQIMDRTERVKRTYIDVMLPILRAAASRLGNESEFSAFAIEVSHHVRKQVLGVTMEHAENLALIVPREVASKLVGKKDMIEQITALRQSVVYVDGKPVTLWPQSETQLGVVHPPAPVAPAPVAAPPRDRSPEALQKQQAQYQSLLDQIVRDLNSQAHFVSYAPPALIAFHKASYLQLSFSTDLAPFDAGSQYRNAALAFDRHISHLVRPLLALVKQEPEFDGVVFSTTVRIPGKTAELGVSQSVEFFFLFTELRRYEQYDVTGQQLINSGIVLINGERAELDLQKAESDLH
jgi:hypothetical protein